MVDLKEKYVNFIPVGINLNNYLPLSVVEPEPDFFAGAGSGLLLCDLGVLRWHKCGNSYNFSQITTIVTQIERTNRYTFRKKQLSSFIFQN